MGSSWGRIWGGEGEEEDLEGVIPQGPSGNSIGFWFLSQRNLFFAKSEKLFCKIISYYSNSIVFFKIFSCIYAAFMLLSGINPTF